MVSKIERRIRQLDDESKSISQRARELVEKFGVQRKPTTIINMLCAKRAGFSSVYAMLNYRVQKKDYGDWSDYIDNKCIQRGFEGNAEYTKYIYERKEGETPEQWRERYWSEQFFKSGFELKPYGRLSRIRDECGNLFLIEVIDRIEQLFDCLNEREVRIIRERFYGGRTLEEVGKGLELSKERVRQIQDRALGKMKRVGRRAGFFDSKDF